MVVIAWWCLGAAWGAPRQLCVFVAADGSVSQVNSIDAVPEPYRGAARCFSETMKPERPRDPRLLRPAGPTETGVRGSGAALAAPEALELDGPVRRLEMPSTVGRIELRWPRSVERLFGRSPERAMGEAARAVSRALKQSSFPPEIQNLNLEWRVVVMDEAKPDGQIPAELVSNCHPGWMTPPAQIYVVAQRVAAGCGGGPPSDSSIADRELANVLMHEMGHAVEYQLIGREFGRSRFRSEGFATWFNGVAADYTTLDAPGRTVELHRALAERALGSGPLLRPFQGSAEDYARAGMVFRAIVARRGVRGLLDVYGVMVRDSIDFLPAINTALGWDDRRVEAEVERIVRR